MSEDATGSGQQQQDGSFVNHGSGAGWNGGGGGTAGVSGEWVVDGKFAQGLSAKLSDDLKPYAGSIRKFEGTPIQDVLRSYGELEKKLGQRMQPPGPEARPEEVAAWRKNLGVPEKPDGYGIARPEDVPVELWNEEMVRGFTAVAHKHHIPAAAAQELVQWWNGQQMSAVSRYHTEAVNHREALVQGLQSEWGERYETNLQGAQRVAAMARLDVNDPAIGDNPTVIRALHAMASLVSEDRQETGGSGALRLTRQQQADDIQTNKSNPLYGDYHGANGSERQAMVAEQIRRLRMG
ncbi:hypothetical protein DES53_115144 [Roseimicrobium gellanilyticum]|uniref:Uncharacterized protein n=1 Tax=Roseimicrobium gellanilyticum TaxID=748857 RepID=A0A366H4S0_9BACT|nr:hypothetical protein [Roseimicrobium gellanilyticum]RBP37003.1 hypothetical protein DES53_115144 [Roseimicrobium gellanilyticum]